MDPKFLDYYTRELTYLREMAGEFAGRHPKIARRLGMDGIDIADPYVERMIEAFCFLSARTQLKLDAEFPRFTQRLLEVVYPNYVAPTPSMAVACLQPCMKEGELSRGFTVPRQTAMRSAIAPGEETPCEFRTGHDVTLWPLEVESAALGGVPPDVPDLEAHLNTRKRPRGALRLVLRTPDSVPVSALTALERLPVYLHGDERIVSQLFELLHTASMAVVVRDPEAPTVGQHVIRRNAVDFEGLAPEQSLLPSSWNVFSGHQLLQEYLSCRQRFYFFALTQLAPGLARVGKNRVEIVVLLDRLPDGLPAHVSGDCFRLFCTPVVNLFPKRTDRVEIDRARTEFHLVPDRSRPLDYEVYAVSRVFGQRARTASEVIFHPLYQTLHSDRGNYGRYFSVRREQRMLSENARKYGTRTPYVGTEVYLSLVDQAEAPYADDIRYLAVEAWVTNRDLPRLVPRNGRSDLTMADSVPVDGVSLLVPPSAPRAPYALGQTAWRLIRQLSFNYLPLSDVGHEDGGQALRNLLRLFVADGEREQIAQIDGLVGARTAPVVRRLPGNGLLAYGRGVECELTVDEAAFSGISPYLFGVVLERYIARHVSINVFCETSLHSMQRGPVARWAPRMGERGAM